jgi:glucose/mannose transport system substrate-binding protein
MVVKFKSALLATCLLAACVGHARAEDIEVLHYWTSGGESKAVNVLKDMVQKQGYTWKDSAIAGGGGANAMTVLKTRVVSGTAPAVVQMRGPVVQDWAEQGVLVPLDSIAGSWSKELPAAIDATLKFQGHYYAAPHWIHRVNWMYLNKPLLDKVGGTVPTNWDEFFALCDKLKSAGYIAIAHGDTPYEDANWFEGVVLSFGPDFFRRAILQQDQAALTSPQMVQVFDILRRFSQYFDAGIQGRSWNLSTAMLIEGKAGIFFMGDWATGEFAAANKVPDKDYICAPRPGTDGSFTFNSDDFVFFRQHGGDATKAQLDVAKDIMSPEYQRQGSMLKGAVPANTTVSTEGFNACSQKSEVALQAAIKANTLMTSMNQGLGEAKLGAIWDVVVKFMNSNQDSKSAAQDLARAAKTS